MHAHKRKDSEQHKELYASMEPAKKKEKLERMQLQYKNMEAIKKNI